jgi:hypothetical protein
MKTPDAPPGVAPRRTDNTRRNGPWFENQSSETCLIRGLESPESSAATRALYGSTFGLYRVDMKSKLALMFFAFLSVIIANQAASDLVLDDRILGPIRILSYDLACLAIPVIGFAILVKFVRTRKTRWFVELPLQLALVLTLISAEFVAAVEVYFRGPIRGTPSYSQKSEKVGSKTVFNGYRNAVGRVFVSEHVIGPVYRVAEVCSSRVGKRQMDFQKVDDEHIRCFVTREGDLLVRVPGA